jgi:hypothetical protein
MQSPPTALRQKTCADNFSCLFSTARGLRLHGWALSGIGYAPTNVEGVQNPFLFNCCDDRILAPRSPPLESVLKSFTADYKITVQFSRCLTIRIVPSSFGSYREQLRIEFSRWVFSSYDVITRLFCAPAAKALKT